MTAKDKGGRPKIVWDDKDRNFFETLCGCMCTKLTICHYMKITDKTLDRLLKDNYGIGFSEAYKRYIAKGIVSLRQAQFKMAMTNPTMNIWLSKQFLGQKDKQEIDHNINNKYENMSDEELKVLYDRLKGVK